ncbi:MAG: alpha/beta fold hydrolase [Burkholderiales bacterium]|nr:alpha/beta fold hydrolase [Burkholderiales bacterium]MDE2454830.1 alpha/beta fold hydrolase [Burkholderiales bacterium]
MNTPTAAEPTMARRLRLEVDRMIQRSLKGLEYLGSPAPAIGTTPRTLLHRRGTLSLYHYHATSAEVYRVPLLLVMATTNKCDIFDLAPGQSLIGFLLGRGYDVYVMDWNPPSREESGLTIENYTLDFIPDSIRRVQQDSGVEEVTLVGYCMGGVLATIYAALNAGGPLKNLACFTTPIDWKQMTLFQALVDQRHFELDRMVDALGNVPSDFIISAFAAQRPVSNLAAQLRLWDNMWNDQYVQGYRMMDRFAAETLPLAGAYFRQTIKQLVWKNALHEGTLRIGGRRVDLKNITVPLLHVTAQHDHLVPPDCARPLVALAGSLDKQEIVLPGGHVSLVAGPNAVKRMWPALDQWLEKRST